MSPVVMFHLEAMCREWFVKFKKSKYDLSDKIFGDRPQKFGRDNLHAISDDDLTRTTLE